LVKIPCWQKVLMLLNALKALDTAKSMGVIPEDEISQARELIIEELREEIEAYYK